MNDQNTCMACSCPCKMHKEHNHPTEKTDEQEEHSMMCSKCGLKTKKEDKSAQHSCEAC